MGESIAQAAVCLRVGGLFSSCCALGGETISKEGHERV
jgi:hypothetical protein